MPLEVGGPEIVRLRGHRGPDARVGVLALPPALLHQAASGQEIPRGTDRRQLKLRMPRRKPGEQLPRAPARMRPARHDDQLRHVTRDPVGTGVRGEAPIEKAWSTVRLKAREPLIAGLPTDAVARTELRHRVQTVRVVLDESAAFIHG
jgi:hypothetical protein